MLKEVWFGLEGSGKSTKKFLELEKKVDPEKPVLFGFKNYRLMLEQINNWSSRFNVPIKDFAVCGFSQDYEPAREAYTNPDMPFIIPSTARFIFTTQALIQRNKHLEFLMEDTYQSVEYAHIVIDEFDYTSGIIPSLDYQVESLRTLRGEITKTLLQWVKSNYTFTDFVKISSLYKRINRGFTVAHWLDSNPYPITFLTSEKLSSIILSSIGFKIVEVTNKDLESKFKGCAIHYWASELITRDFILEMNRNVGWNRLPYDLVISDSILPYYSAPYATSSLEIQVLNHELVKGSNEHRGKRILTVLSYIPPQVIKEISDALAYFGSEFSFETVEALFYRDRLCQAVGRSLGYRGGTETDLIVHSFLFNGIKEIDSVPYSFVEKDILEPLSDKVMILDGVKTKKEKKKAKNKSKSKPEPLTDFSFLDQYFCKDSNSKVATKEVVDYCKKVGIYELPNNRKLTATKIVKYFGLKTTSMRKGKSTVQAIVGLSIRD